MSRPIPTPLPDFRQPGVMLRILQLPALRPPLYIPVRTIRTSPITRPIWKKTAWKRSATA
ncbi:hypothetical protein [Chromobacterium piscinae]|uniref:hypothetical protein n=1 Tax=Chromobacterium piscinae TaxID=686831 RepID=UPI0032617BBA